MQGKQLETYTREFWEAAQELADKQVHRCYKCFRVRGEVKNARKNGLAHGSDRGVARADVRLVLVAIDGVLVPRLACTKCVPWPKEPAEDRQLINQLTPSLFGGSIESPTNETKHESK
jgi:hypothetical protein